MDPAPHSSHIHPRCPHPTPSGKILLIWHLFVHSFNSLTEHLLNSRCCARYWECTKVKGLSWDASSLIMPRDPTTWSWVISTVLILPFLTLDLKFQWLHLQHHTQTRLLGVPSPPIRSGTQTSSSSMRALPLWQTMWVELWATLK